MTKEDKIILFLWILVLTIVVINVDKFMVQL